jgi:predicted deacylase
VASKADAWIDLHGGDLPEALIPFIGVLEHEDSEIRRRTEAMLAVFGIEHVLRPSHLAGTSLSSAADLGIPCLLAEAGQLGRRDEPDTRMLLQGLYNVTRHLGIVPGPAPAPVSLTYFRDWPWLRADRAGCWYPAVELGDRVQAGTRIGVITDYFGELLSEHLSPAAGIVTLLNTSLAIDEGEALAGIGVAS